MRNKLCNKYKNYLELLKDSYDENSNYKDYILKYEEIITNKISKSNKSKIIKNSKTRIKLN